MSERLGDALSAIAEVFGSLGLAWYVFGARAVAVWARERATLDLDVTVIVDRLAFKNVAEAVLDAGFERARDDADRLVVGAGMLPARHIASGMPVDIVAGSSGFEAEAMRRAMSEIVEQFERALAKVSANHHP